MSHTLHDFATGDATPASCVPATDHFRWGKSTDFLLPRPSSLFLAGVLQTSVYCVRQPLLTVSLQNMKLYDLVSKAGTGGPYWSPNTAKTRLSLLAKQCPFEVVDVTFKDCRAGYVKEKFGANPALGKPTVPVLELDDGTAIVDSVEIALWLDKKFPNKTSIFAPELPLPIDCSSPEYKAAVEGTKAFIKEATSGFNPLFALCVQHIHASLSKEGEDCDYDYFVSDAKFGKVWDKLTQFDDATLMKMSHAKLTKLFPPSGSKFLSSNTKPGFKDFVVFGGYVTFHCLPTATVTEVWDDASPEVKTWVHSMLAEYPDISDAWKTAGTQS